LPQTDRGGACFALGLGVANKLIASLIRFVAFEVPGQAGIDLGLCGIQWRVPCAQHLYSSHRAPVHILLDGLYLNTLTSQQLAQMLS
jgi:hypothetical protein